MKSRRTLLNHVLLALLMLSLSLTGLACGRGEKKAVAKPQRQTLVTTAPVASREVVYTLEQVGSLRASERATLRSEVAGTVSQILFTQGSQVPKGKVLVRLDDTKIRAEIRNLQARIEQLKVRLAFKSKTLERNEVLLKRSAIAQHRYDELATEVKETELAISQVRAELARQQDMLDDTVIQAPFAGVVGSKDISPGDYLKVGAPVVELVVLDPLEIDFLVPERYKSKLSLGQKVDLRVAAEGERRFSGEIVFISPTVEVKTRSFLVKAKVANPDRRLNPGMFARVSLVTEVHPQAVVVPWASVIQTEKETYLYLLEDQTARKVPIELGKVTADWAEVLSPPLKPGTAVIVEGKFAAKDGGKVDLKKAPAPAAQAKQ